MQYEEAVKVLKTFEKSTDSPLSYYYLGKAYERMSCTVTRRVLQQSRRAETGFQQALIDLGLSLENNGRYDEAAGIFQEILTLNPLNQNVAQHLVQLYIQQQRLEDALALLKTLSVEGIEGQEVRRKIGLIYLELEKYDEAIKEFTAILAKNPEADPIRLYLATCYAEKKEYDRAIEEFSKIPATSQIYFDALGQIAFLYKEKGDSDRATTLLKDAIAKHPEKPELYLFLSDLRNNESTVGGLKVLTGVEKSSQRHLPVPPAVLHDKSARKHPSAA
jgi:tetratricopeptide (TPR) repeat protein